MKAAHCEFQILNAKVRVSVLCPGAVQTPILDFVPTRASNLWGEYSAYNLEPPAWRLAWQKFIDGGRAPSEMAAAVIDAVRNERFYIIPAPELLPIVRTRMEAILEQRNPALSLLPEIVTAIDEGRIQAAKQG